MSLLGILGIIAGVVGYLVTIIGAVAQIRKATKSVHAVVEGQKCLLRSQITATYYRHVDDSEPTLREYERKNLDDLCAAYTALGGNSFVKDLYETMRSWRIRT